MHPFGEGVRLRFIVTVSLAYACRAPRRLVKTWTQLRISRLPIVPKCLGSKRGAALEQRMARRHERIFQRASGPKLIRFIFNIYR